jgi:ribosomal-protein-alanine N-acetyltransferase
MIVIRAMKQEDVAGVMRIEEVVCEFPWTYSIFSDCIKVGYGCWVLEDQDEREIIGYGLVSKAGTEAHILNICIKPEWQGQGLGRRMMLHLINEGKKMLVDTVYLEVRVSNHRAFELYRTLGFTVIGQRKDYYPAKDGREDANVLQLSLKE